MADPDVLLDGPEDAPWTLVLAHGAGQPKESEFLDGIARRIGERGIRVVRFDFPYMARARAIGARRPPDPMPVLEAAFRELIEAFAPLRHRLIIGGKSLGGRVASLIADGEGVAGLVCLGYPFHPPGKPDRLRLEHLRELRTPALICQGERDPFGGRGEVEGYGLTSGTRLFWLEEGDHSFTPPKRTSRSLQDNLDAAAAATAEFILGLGETLI